MSRWLVCLFLLPFWVAAAPRAVPVPGGVAVIDLAPATELAPQAYYKDRPILVRAWQGQWQAVIGIPLESKPGTHHLELCQDRHCSQRTFLVADKRYAEQRIRLKDQGMVEPGATALRRIARERAHLDRVLATFSAAPPSEWGFDRPAPGPLSSPFGLKRFFNDRPRKPHSGLDLAAPRGAPVTAPAAARVIDTGHYYFNGNTVVLDHGQGLLTIYCHLDRIDVQVGDRLERGKPLGTVGKTGRATGPHLHWGVNLNRTPVDPMLFLDRAADGDIPL